MAGFNIVPEASMPPGKCIASRDAQGPFIDTGNQVTERGYVYVSCRWVEEVARQLGMVPKAKVEELEGQLAMLAEDIQKQRHRVDLMEKHAELTELVGKEAGGDGTDDSIA